MSGKIWEIKDAIGTHNEENNLVKGQLRKVSGASVY